MQKEFAIQDYTLSSKKPFNFALENERTQINLFGVQAFQ